MSPLRLLLLILVVRAGFGGVSMAAPSALPLAELRALPEVGYQLGGVAYYGVPYFANALATGEWLEYEGETWGSAITTFQNPQFDAHGLPQYLKADRRLRVLFWPLHVSYEDRPANWPNLVKLADGKWLVTWKGDADVRLPGGAFVPEGSSGPEQGALVDGRRYYRCDSAALRGSGSLTIDSINPNNPIKDLKLWMPDPANPETTLEGRVFHPTFLQRLSDRDWGYIRFMDWGTVNGSPQKNWSDRRLPGYSVQNGILDPRRSPAEGVVLYTDPEGVQYFVSTNRATGVAWEHMVSLCNATGRDLWLTVPHLTVESKDDYLGKLARLIAFGSDGVNPYAGPTLHPVYAPLAANRKVYVEFSNEIWAANNGFAQGFWAINEALKIGLSYPQFVARQFSKTWSELESVLGPERVVRVAAVGTGQDFYTKPFIREFYENPALLHPELMAVTTYFGNNIQYWVKTNITRIAGKAAKDPYWLNSPELNEDLNLAFDRWAEYLLTESGFEAGSGQDTVDVTGGFPAYIRDISAERGLPIVAYEGGPSLYTDGIDNARDGSSADITHFIGAMNRHPRIQDMYRIHLEFAKWRGLCSHTIFIDAGAWSKYGQWGHMESLDQPLAEAPKYAFILNWAREHDAIRHPNDPLNSVPAFATPEVLPFALSGRPYDVPISIQGGDGLATVEVITSVLPDGLTFDPSTRHVSGMATTQGSQHGFLFLRVTDADGDPAWRLFTVDAFGAAHGVTLNPIEDVSAILWEPDAAHADDARHWIVGNSTLGWGARAFFKFDLANLVNFPMKSATFRFRISDISRGPEANDPIRVLAYGVEDDWSEATLTVNNEPPIGVPVSSPVGIANPGWYELDLTQNLGSSTSVADKLYSFVLQTDPSAPGNLNAASRENAALGDRPQLVLTFHESSLAPRLRANAISGGQLEMSMTSEPLARVELQSSTDLRNWLPERVISLDARGEARWTIPIASVEVLRAFRLVRP